MRKFAIWLATRIGLRTLRWRRLVQREAHYLVATFGPDETEAFLRAGVPPDLTNQSRDTFFVLGNGESSNALTQKDFAAIAGGFSVGLNAWPIHPFVPDAYAFELFEGADREKDEFEFLVALASKKARKGNRALWLLRPRPAEMDRLEELRARLPGLAFQVYGRVNVATNSLDELDSELDKSLAFLKNDISRVEIVIDNGSSVVRMISLALLRGFRKIVLVGVDLNDGAYFWYSDCFVHRYGDFRGVCRRRPGEGKDTLSTDTRPFSAFDFIAALDRVARKNFGAEIFVASASSALAKVLKVYDFSIPAGEERIEG